MHPLSVIAERRIAVRRSLHADLERYLEHAAALDGALAPGELELGFGFTGADAHSEASELPAFELGGGVSMRGRIDRIDVAPGGDAVVIDYKARSAPPGARWLKDGQLQVALYMQAARQLLGLRVIGGLYQPLSGRTLQARGAMSVEEPPLECKANDLYEPEELEELLDAALAAARQAAAEAASGALRAEARHVRLPRRLFLPHDLSLRALSMEQLRIDLDALSGEQDGAPAGGIELTAEQQPPVERRGESLLLSAAAGSGKTSVLVERFVRAVREDGVAPSAILAITFTERAAGELRARVRARLLELGDRQGARDTEAAFVGTFHGFCARLLRAHPLPAGLDPEFAVLDDGQSGRLREAAFAAALAAFLDGEPAAAVDLVAAYGVDGVRATIEQIHGELRSRGQRRPRLPISPAASAAEPLAREAVAALALLERLLGLFCERYEALKAQRSSVDFDDLELIAGQLLAENDGLRASWSERFVLLMVDEFQDTNPRQLALIQALARENLFTVGDELQSIYGFRHADVSLFRARRREPRAIRPQPLADA